MIEHERTNTIYLVFMKNPVCPMICFAFDFGYRHNRFEVFLTVGGQDMVSYTDTNVEFTISDYSVVCAAFSNSFSQDVF